MNDKQAAFLPFNAINEFMTDEYRQEVVRTVLTRQVELPGSTQAALNKLSKKAVSVPGFRNGAKAPASLKVKPFIKAFEKDPGVAAEVISAWGELHAELRTQIYELLTSLDWEVLPPEADRTKLPGFIPEWPTGQDFEHINQVFAERYPSAVAETNDVSLMVVWLSGRLPVNVGSGEDEAPE